MRRCLAILIALLLLPAGCASEPPSAPEEPRPTRTLSLFVREGASEEARRALQVFCETAERVSEGTLLIETASCEDGVAALDAGGDLIFLPNSEAARANGDFLSYTSPFYFLDETHLSATLNSEEFASRIRGKTQSLLGASPLAAFYGGSRVFVSDQSEELDACEGWKGIRAVIGEGSELLPVVLEHLGATAIERAPETLIEGFLSRSYRTIECEPEELRQLTDRRIGGQPVVVYRTMHAVSLDWLMLSDETAQTLSEAERAALAEAAAAALAANESAVNEREAAAFAYAESIGVPVYEIDYDAFCEQTDEAFLSAVRYRNLWDWELHRAVRDFARVN